MVHKLTIRLDDDTWKPFRPKVRREMGASATGFYEAVSRLYLAGELPQKLIDKIGAIAREVDDERAPGT